jgi:phosphoenolpyruvate-protein phosphotransferase
VKTLHGIPAARGIAIGPVFQFKKTELRIERRTVSDPQAELQRLEGALEQARRELALVLEKARGEVEAGTASIFEAHAMMLEDPDYLAAMQEKIKHEALNAEAAAADATEMYAGMLEQMEDEYLRARAADIRDVGMRIVRNLSGQGDSPTLGLVKPSIILAEELTPSDTITFDKAQVLGFCTVGGGPTAHVAILARELGLPAVVSMGEDILGIPDGTPLVIDGSEGILVVEPDEASAAVKREQATSQANRSEAARRHAKQPAITRDGHRVEVVANIGNIESAALALESGAEGVGLLRTEFLYLERARMPDEDEQYMAYRAILDVFGDQPVILRTLDIGGDKELPYLTLSKEMNPFLGLRAIRLCLARPDIFKPQLKAALRAGVDRNLKLMFPMVATVAEVHAARALLEECRLELLARGQPVISNLEVGIMVEIPAAVIMADQLAAEVDFFSIGTNDLSQYTMAADRTNGSVAALADAFQPAVLRLVRDVVQAAHSKGKWVGICGELAGEPLAIPLLLGLGLDELSMNPPAIPLAKQILRELTVEEASQITQAALEMENPDQIRHWLESKNPL